MYTINSKFHCDWPIRLQLHLYCFCKVVNFDVASSCESLTTLSNITHNIYPKFHSNSFYYITQLLPVTNKFDSIFCLTAFDDRFIIHFYYTNFIILSVKQNFENTDTQKRGLDLQSIKDSFLLQSKHIFNKSFFPSISNLTC